MNQKQKFYNQFRGVNLVSLNSIVCKTGSICYCSTYRYFRIIAIQPDRMERVDRVQSFADCRYFCLVVPTVHWHPLTYPKWEGEQHLRATFLATEHNLIHKNPKISCVSISQNTIHIHVLQNTMSIVLQSEIGIQVQP